MLKRTMPLRDGGFKTRADDGNYYIEGYFAVYNSDYWIWSGGVENVAPGAFDETVQTDDIRALTNHDSTLVLGRNTAGTLTLRPDERGLWGSILINPDDQDALNLHSRVARGDVSQCSFGFEILDEAQEVQPDGTVRWTILKVKLYEVSVCTFPAYEETGVEARQKEAETLRRRKAAAWQERARRKLKGDGEHGT